MNRSHLTRHQARPRQHTLLALCLAALAMVPALSCAGDTTPLLARELAAEGRYDAAAIEFRRAALAAESDEAAGYYWAAAHAYRRAGRPAQASAMLDRAEDASAALHREATLLRADIAADLHQWHEAEFYLDSASRSELNPDARVAVARKLAATRLMLDQPDGATQALRAAPRQDPAWCEPFDRYLAGSDKSPRLGGLLGLLPGLGYAYSGEYANGLRSLILNALFIYGLVDTASDEQWGAFGVIAFFELTWYTGSIYGGIDAAHRYNRTRLESAVTALSGAVEMQPDHTALPSVTIRWAF